MILLVTVGIVIGSVAPVCFTMVILGSSLQRFHGLNFNFIGLNNVSLDTSKIPTLLILGDNTLFLMRRPLEVSNLVDT